MWHPKRRRSRAAVAWAHPVVHRVVTALALCLLLAVSVVPALAQTPEPEPTPEPPFPPWHATDAASFEVDGEPVAVSPDGRRIAGIGPDGDSICVWDVERLEPTCGGEDLNIQDHPITGGIAWAPDSSAVAFVNGNWRELEPTDVMLFDVDHGWLLNLTHTSMAGDVLVYTGPSWTADSGRIVFARTDPSAGDDEQPASIIYYDRAFRASVPVPLEDAFYIYTPVVVMPDDSVLFRIDLSPVSTENGGIWRVDPNGENLRQVLGGEDSAPIESPVMISLSGNGDYLLVASEMAIARLDFSGAFHLVETGSGDVVQLGLEDGEIASQPVFADAARFLLIQDGTGTGGSVRLMDPETRETQVLEGLALPDPWVRHPPTWAASGTVLVPMDGGGLLLRLEPAVHATPRG